MDAAEERVQQRQRVVSLAAGLAREIRDCAIWLGQRRRAQIEARRKPLDRPAHDAGGVLHVDLALDLHAELGERPFGGEGVGNVAERVLVNVEPAILGDIDAPVHHIVPVMIARGEAQGLDHAVGRRVVMVAGLVRDADAHGGIIAGVVRAPKGARFGLPIAGRSAIYRRGLADAGAARIIPYCQRAWQVRAPAAGIVPRSRRRETEPC